MYTLRYDPYICPSYKRHYSLIYSYFWRSKAHQSPCICNKCHDALAYDQTQLYAPYEFVRMNHTLDGATHIQHPACTIWGTTPIFVPVISDISHSFTQSHVGATHTKRPTYAMCVMTHQHMTWGSMSKAVIYATIHSCIHILVGATHTKTPSHDPNIRLSYMTLITELSDIKH